MVDGGVDSAECPVDTVVDAAAVQLVETGASKCNDQRAQEFLVRKNFIPIASHRAEHDKALRYRITEYGRVKGFGNKGLNARTAAEQVVATRFMGISVRLHKRVVPALACVEAELHRVCDGTSGVAVYKPQALAGIRDKNTYRGGEVTNHLFGIAIDIDPQRNTCCHCVKPWSAHPLCKKKTKSVYERMAMPECWVRVFEQFGFYWLGHDVLEDTMHFEFLGEPSKISR